MLGFTRSQFPFAFFIFFILQNLNKLITNDWPATELQRVGRFDVSFIAVLKYIHVVFFFFFNFPS